MRHNALTSTFNAGYVDVELVVKMSKQSSERWRITLHIR